ncbi:MAG TPA: DNA mismatch repair protein [Polyangiaceae bacterium]|jgi:DNA mismatch repair protein MutS2|nr:DNA mismatch repair protein [Polyangiaceae bacterium]
MTKVPDLLYPEPQPRLEARALRQALTFAFATGGTAEIFNKIWEKAEFGASDFASDCFARELFLSDFVARCLTITVGGQKYVPERAHLQRVLAHPPRDPNVTKYRQEILRELAQHPEHALELGRLAAKIRLLVLKLEAPDRGKRYDAIGRRVDILRSVRELIDELSSAFAQASSGLSRIRQFADEQRKIPAYETLVNLLEHENDRATLELRVKVGYDGELRSFQIVRSHENQENPFYRTRFGRFLTKLTLWIQGYGFREGELLGRLTNAAFDGVQDCVMLLFQLLVDMEFYLASLSLKTLAASNGLEMCLPVLETAPDARTELEELFNPFLLLEERPPKTARVSAGPRALVVITGPNSGGKTRLLQALGLSQLLGQCGAFVPAARAHLPVRHGLFVSLSHEASSDQREGRLGTELLRIRRMFEQLSFGSLVILDELCSGTNPSEGEEIFELVVSLLAELEPQAFITTHFLQFASRLEQQPPVARLEFLQVELDAQQTPTYGFIPGVATTSLAERTAERLGVTREALRELVERARTRSTGGR